MKFHTKSFIFLGDMDDCIRSTDVPKRWVFQDLVTICYLCQCSDSVLLFLIIGILCDFHFLERCAKGYIFFNSRNLLTKG